MKTLFSMDSKFFVFMGKVADLIILNLLWLVCSIPIVTIGASTTALYYTSLKIVRNEDTYPSKMFFHSFKQNLKQGTLLTLLFLAIGVFLFFDIQIVKSMEGKAGDTLTTIFYILVILFAVIISYAFPILAQFDNSIRHILCNSFLMALSHLPRTVVITILTVLPWVNLIKDPELFAVLAPGYALFGMSLLVRINTRMFVKIFARYMPKDETEEPIAEESEEEIDPLDPTIYENRIFTLPPEKIKEEEPTE